MAEKLDPRQVATFEELLRACLYEQEALRRVLVRKGVLTTVGGAGGDQRGKAGDGGEAGAVRGLWR